MLEEAGTNRLPRTYFGRGPIPFAGKESYAEFADSLLAETLYRDGDMRYVDDWIGMSSEGALGLWGRFMQSRGTFFQAPPVVCHTRAQSILCARVYRESPIHRCRVCAPVYIGNRPYTGAEYTMAGTW